MSDFVFLDGLSLTFKGIRQNEIEEREFIEILAELLEGTVEYKATGGKGYPRRAVITGYHDGLDWSVFCFYGSGNLGQSLNVEAKGENTERFRDVALSLGVDWSLTRADIAMDMQMDFGEAHKICKDYALRKGIKTSLVGDWEGKSAGRTYYVGASRKNSESFIRLYEKGIEMMAKGFGGVPLDLVRLELEYKPHKHKREKITELGAPYLLSLALNPLELFQSFADLGIEPVRIEARKEPDYKTSVWHMLSQYRKSIKTWVEEEGLDSFFDEVKSALRERV